MTYKAVLKLGQVVDPDVLMNGLPANRSCRTLFQTRALTLMPRGAPVLVGHNSEREVGRVDELVEWPDVDGLWLFARCSIDAPPGWLRRGTAASFECLPLRQQRMGDWNRVTRGLFREASILPPGVLPAEPRAAVWLIQRAAEPSSTTQRRSVSTAPASAQPSPGEVFYTPPDAVIRRPVGRVLAVR